MNPIRGLPLHRRIPPRLHDKHVIRLYEIECDTAGLQGHEENLDVGRVREVVDGRLALGGRHVSLEEHGFEAGRVETEFEKTEEGGELREDDGFRGGVGGAEAMEFCAEGFDFRGGAPIFMVDPRGDAAVFCDGGCVDFWGAEVDGDVDVAFGAVWCAPREGGEVAGNAVPAEYVVAFGFDRVYAGRNADGADGAGFAVVGEGFAEDQVGVVGHLPHARDEGEDVGVVVL